MKLNEHFDLREFVSEETWKKWGGNSLWFVAPEIFNIATFYKSYFTEFYRKKYAKVGREVVDVQVIVNTWLWGGDKIGRGYREPEQYLTGQFRKNPRSESAHRQGRAFDCVMKVVFEGGGTAWADINEVNRQIQLDQSVFYSVGVRRIEHIKLAPTWLHTDIFNTGLQWRNKIYVIGA